MQTGERVGDYLLLREVGKGTFSVVYLAQQVYLGTEVTIKVLLNTSPEERAALLAEAKKIAAWRHPHIIHVVTFSEHETLPYLVLQYAPHGTLKERYPLGQAFPLDALLPHVQQIAEGLQYAHDRQTLHLDLKPANVLLDEQQAALISDFGISVILLEQQTHKSLAGFAGTPAYAAPEQLQEKPGKASDQYALATMVYQWLTGRLPFTGGVWAIGVQKVTSGPPPLGAHVPPAVAQVVLKALAKDPGERYPSVRDFAQALAQAPQTLPLAGPPAQPQLVSQTPTKGMTALPPSLVAAAPSLKPGALLRTCPGHRGRVFGVAWSPDGACLASAGSDATVRVWDAASGQHTLICQGHADAVWDVAWAPDGARLASASTDGTVRVWDAANGTQLLACKQHNYAVYRVAWSPDGKRLASAGYDGTVRLWDAANGRLLLTCQGHTSSVRGVAWAPDGKRLASASEDKTLRLWEPVSGKPLLTYQGHADVVWGVAWAPDLLPLNSAGRGQTAAGGARLASASEDQTMRVWDAASGKPLLTCKGHEYAVYGVAWAPEGRRLASAGHDGTARVWDAASGRQLLACQGHTFIVSGVAWAPEGRRLASAGHDGTVRVWWVG